MLNAANRIFGAIAENFDRVADPVDIISRMSTLNRPFIRPILRVMFVSFLL